MRFRLVKRQFHTLPVEFLPLPGAGRSFAYPCRCDLQRKLLLVDRTLVSNAVQESAAIIETLALPASDTIIRHIIELDGDERR